MRKVIVAGNWKMNMNHTEARALAENVIEQIGDFTDAEAVLCPPFSSLGAVQDVIGGTNVSLGAQNMHWENSGAYTGEISANMLLTMGCSYVILGHSERRKYFHESDVIVARKVKAALSAGLTPIVCVGESKEERESGITTKVVETQVRGALEGLSAEAFNGSVIAYEPVWAIGTGLTATTGQAQEVHAFIRKILRELFGVVIADSTRIQYGGSMNQSNAVELLIEPDIDGGLIGGAALKAESFARIVMASQK